MPEAIAFYDPGTDITAQAAGAIGGKRLVAISADKQPGADGPVSASTLGGNVIVNVCGAGAKAFGVADVDMAVGDKRNISRGPKVMPVITGTGGVTAGQEVQSDAAGGVVPFTTGIKVGLALATSAAGEDAVIALYP